VSKSDIVLSGNVLRVLNVLKEVLSGLPGYTKSEVEQQFSPENLASMRQALLSGDTLGSQYGFDETKYHQLPERLLVFYYILSQQNTVEPLWPELINFLEVGLLSLKNTKSYFTVSSASNLFKHLIGQLPSLLLIFDEKLKNFENCHGELSLLTHQDVVMAWISVYTGLQACEFYLNRYPLLGNMIPNMNDVKKLFEQAKQQKHQLQQCQQLKPLKETLCSSGSIQTKTKTQYQLKQVIFLLLFIYQANFFKKNHWINHPKLKRKVISILAETIKIIKYPGQSYPMDLIISSRPLDSSPAIPCFYSPSFRNLSFYKKQINQLIDNSGENIISTRIDVINILISALNDIKTQASENRQRIIIDWINELLSINKKYEILLNPNTNFSNTYLIDIAMQNAELLAIDNEIINVFQEKLRQLQTTYTPNEAPVLTRWLNHIFTWVKTLFGSSTLARARKLSLWAGPAFMPPCREGLGVLSAMSIGNGFVA